MTTAARKRLPDLDDLSAQSTLVKLSPACLSSHIPPSNTSRPTRRHPPCSLRRSTMPHLSRTRASHSTERKRTSRGPVYHTAPSASKRRLSSKPVSRLGLPGSHTTTGHCEAKQKQRMETPQSAGSTKESARRAHQERRTTAFGQQDDKLL